MVTPTVVPTLAVVVVSDFTLEDIVLSDLERCGLVVEELRFRGSSTFDTKRRATS